MKALMNRQLGEVQTRLLSRLLLDKEYALASGRHPVHAKLLEFLSPAKGRRVLELGCGPGKYAALLASAGFDVVAVDPIPFPTWATIRAHSSVQLQDSVFAEDLPYKDASFDHVACLGALLYFENPERALSEMLRVLRPGGRLVLRTINKNNLYTLNTGKRLDPASRQLYTMDELIALLTKSGFSTVDSFSYGFWPPVLTNIWWYLICVWIPQGVQDWLSQRVDPSRRVNNTVFAVKIP